jgi:acetoacetyl-CoA synthetase
MPTPLWTPTSNRINQSNLKRFMQYVNSMHAVQLDDYATLYQWSIDHPDLFWNCVWEFCNVRSQRRADTTLTNANLMPGAKWFAGAQLNFAENLTWRNDDHIALTFNNERETHRTLTYRQLRNQVARVASALRNMGVVSGDRVAGFLPNVPEAVIAMLATTSIGAIWSSCSPDFGIAGVCDRFGQITPKVLFAADGYFYSGKTIDCLPVVREVVSRINSIEHVIVIPYSREPTNFALTAIRNAHHFNEIGDQQAALIFTSLPFDHPLYILYSSGTTGVPKCIVHSAGGTLLQHLKELVLHTDLKPDDRLFYFTTCGWMMWNWLVSALATGATVVLYDGSPLHPDARVLWRMATREKITHFGTSPRYLASCEKEALKPDNEFDLSALRVVLSTGSPLTPESFNYVYRDIKADVQLSSISGGTDIVSCFALGCPIQPVYEGELQCRGLGMRVEIFDDEGNSIHQQQGELVCTAPFPSMPIGFWNDVDGSKYRAAYFERFNNTWCHGDFAELTDRGGLIIYGRSDAVLNPGGVRIGTAEIYRQVDKLDQVLESLAIGQDWQGDVRVVLFVRLRPELNLDAALIQLIRETIRRNTSPRHVPAKIIQVADLPRTRSGKLVELAVRNVIHNKPIKNIEALANPEALEYFRDLAELKI